MLDLVGKVLGKYRIVEKIGSGGMANVYKGLQVGLEREVAIKVLPPAYAKDLDRLKRFRRESQATAKLSHPNIITIYDSGEQDGFYYYVMEYLKAESLETIIKDEGKLALKQALKIAKDVLKALVYTHDKSIIHRDLKPGNIRFDLRGNAIVTDFGLVKDLEETSITMTGISIGTPQYMSPEQLLGEDVDERSDLYQLAVLFYEMICGQTPFAGKSPYSDGQDKDTPPITPPTEFQQDIPEALEELILKSLSRNPDDRHQSADEMLQALTKVERKVEARQASLRSATSTATRGFSTRSVSTSRALSTAAPTISSSVSDLSTGEKSDTYHYVLSLLAGPSYQEQTKQELFYNVLMVVVPAVLTIILLVLYVSGNLFPKPRLKLLEQAIEEQSNRAIIAWKANANCYSYIEYYTSLDSRQSTKCPQDTQSEFREELTNLEPDTTYYFQFVFTYDPDDTESYMYSRELEFKTKPEIKLRSIREDPSDTEVRINWTSNIETDTKVRLGKTRDHSIEQENPKRMRETNHSITISGLEPNTRYHYIIVATDPDQEGQPVYSKDRTFKTLPRGQTRSMFQDNKSNEPPLVELAKSYVDKLTRMTPDERQKLKHSLQNYLIIDADKILTPDKKKEIINNSSNNDNFNDRLRFFKVWKKQLKENSISHDFNNKEGDILSNLYFINPKKAFEKLDKYLRKLGTLDGVTNDR